MEPFKTYMPHLYTMQGAKSAVILILLWGTGGVFLVSMILFRRRMKGRYGFRTILLKVIFPIPGTRKPVA